MSEYKKIDLRNICNHKLIYGKEILPKEREGLDGIYIAAQDAHISPSLMFADVEFDFVLSDYDNVMCESQRIVAETKADKLHIIGFSYWGDTTDVFQAKYEDGSCECLKISFVDWSHELGWWGMERTYSEIGTAHKVISSGAAIHIIYFHHITAELNGNKVLKELILPDNFWLHIFAITLEDTRERCAEEEQKC